MSIKPTTDRAAVVDTEFHWLDAKEFTPPRSSKVLCINKNHGAPLPTFKKGSK